MFKNKKLWLVGSVVCMLVGFVLWGVISKTTASVSHKEYQTATYTYEVEVDTYYDATLAANVEGGIIVKISPERPYKDASGFSEAYFQQSDVRLAKWVSEKRAGKIDVLIIFNQPLMLDTATSVLQPIGAEVFESGFVGYEDNIPFAGYLKEDGKLTRSMQECAELRGGNIKLVDLRGYLAVRAWVDITALDVLNSHKLVRVVDTTPQDARDRLAQDPLWQEKVVQTVALEMPVWAYEWE